MSGSLPEMLPKKYLQTEAEMLADPGCSSSREPVPSFPWLLYLRKLLREVKSGVGGGGERQSLEGQRGECGLGTESNSSALEPEGL